MKESGDWIYQLITGKDHNRLLTTLDLGPTATKTCFLILCYTCTPFLPFLALPLSILVSFSLSRSILQVIGALDSYLCSTLTWKLKDSLSLSSRRNVPDNATDCSELDHKPVLKTSKYYLSTIILLNNQTAF